MQEIAVHIIKDKIEKKHKSFKDSAFWFKGKGGLQRRQ